MGVLFNFYLQVEKTFADPTELGSKTNDEDMSMKNFERPEDNPEMKGHHYEAHKRHVISTTERWEQIYKDKTWGQLDRADWPIGSNLRDKKGYRWYMDPTLVSAIEQK